ncbi:MAG TPA: hypothetical protein VIG08_09615 [Gemmatimonadales bacterium]|jgi:hypothetical protein
MIATVLWLLLQAGGPTVGDTIWLSRTVALPAGRTPRAADWRPEDPVEVLAPPVMTTRGDSITITYPVVIWRAGEQVIEIPGPLFLGFGGEVDSLPPERHTIRVSSVLPRVPSDSVLAPQPRADYVPRGAHSILPVVLALALAILLLAPLHWWWRRRGPASGPPPAGPTMRPVPLDRWADAGESRAVAASVTSGLRATIARYAPSAHRGLDTETLLTQLALERPDWPLADVGALLRALDEARFGAGAETDVIPLARGAADVESRLAGSAT